jgi:beta-phosphoglucomutase-like phosphatase (HAD superfamily)
MLRGLRLEPFFEALVLGEECARAKPHPDPYLRGLELIGLAGSPRDAIAVEDSPAGLRAAVAAGIPTVGVTSTQSAEALLEAGACAVVADFHELLALVVPSSGGGGGGGVGGGGSVGRTGVAVV